MVRAMVHSIKHYSQRSVETVTAGAIKDFIIANAVNVSIAGGAGEVIEGSSIKAVYVEMWVRSPSATPATQIMILEKRVAGGAAPLTAEMADLNGYNNKKNIFYTTQGLVNDNDANAINLSHAWHKIPKSKQRFGLGDSLNLVIFAQGAVDVLWCGFTTYKEYS